MNPEAENLQSVFDRTFTGLARAREAFTPQLLPREVGTVTSVATGIAMVSGLPGVGFEELLKFPGNIFGIAFNVDEEEIGGVLLGRFIPPYVRPHYSAAHTAAIFAKHAARIRLGAFIACISMSLVGPWGCTIAAQIRRSPSPAVTGTSSASRARILVR